MGILSSLRAKIGRAILPSDFKEAVDTVSPLLSELVDDDENKFRRLGDKSIREMSSRRRERQLRLAYFLYLFYPAAKRVTELTRDFTVGEGLKIEADEPRVETVIKDFWFHPVNRIDLRQFTYALELSLYGEQVYPVAVNEENGFVRIGYIDPLQVHRVKVDLANVQQPTELLISQVFGSEANPDIFGIQGVRDDTKLKTLKVIRADEELSSKSFGRLNGEVFFFTINKVSNATRGNSDMLPAIDWIELHEQFLMKIHEAADIKTSIVQDIEVEGADEEELDRLRRKHGPIKAGTSWWHNESMKLTTRTADLQTSDLAEHAGILKRHIAMAYGFPEHWLSDPGGANRATAAEMGVPTTKKLRARQRIFVEQWRFVVNFVIDKAIEHGTLPADIDRSFTITAPQIWAIDTQRITSSLVTGAQALMIAEQNGWIQNDEAAKTFRFIADQLGISLSSIKFKSGSEKFTDEQKHKAEEWFDGVHEDRLMQQGEKYAAAVAGRKTGPGTQGVRPPS